MTTYMVTTNEGVRVFAGSKKGEGITQAQAESDADARNRKAEALGIKARYTVAEYTTPQEG